MSNQGEEITPSDFRWPDIFLGVHKADVTPLLQLLRSDDPITKLVRKLLADLFDPQKPIGIYAKIVLVRGNKSENIRNYELYKDCEAWKYDNKLDRIPHKQWEKFRAQYKIASVVAAKAAYAKGCAISDMLSEINAL